MADGDGEEMLNEVHVHMSIRIGVACGSADLGGFRDEFDYYYFFQALELGIPEPQQQVLL